MRGPVVVLVLAMGLVALLLALRGPRPGPGPHEASARASAAAAAGPLWPLSVGNAWVYSETSPERPGTAEVTVAVTAEERTGFRLVEERAGRGSDTDLIEVREDGYAYAEFESSAETTLLLPKKAPALRDWACKADMRAAIVRDTEFALDGRTYPAFDVRYEKKLKRPDGSETWAEQMTLTFAPGLGIVRKDTTHMPAPASTRNTGRPTHYVWELLRFSAARR